METKDLSSPIQSIQHLLQEAQHLIYKDSARGLELAQTALKHWEVLATSQELALKAEIYLVIGEHFSALTNFAESYTHLNQALAIFEQLEDIEGRIRCLHILHNLYFQYGETDDSLTFTLRLLELLQQSPDKRMESKVLIGLGTVYNKIGDYEQERITYERAEAIQRELNEPLALAALKNNQAMVYMALEESDRAFGYVLESLDILRAEEATYGVIVALCTAGEICTQQQKYEMGEQYFRQGEQLSEQHQFESGKTHVYHGLCELYMAQHDYRQANQLAAQTLEQAQATNMLSIEVSAHKLLSQSYKQLGSYEKALTHFETYHELYKKNNSEQMQRRLTNLRVVYETDQARKNAEIVELKNGVLEQEIQKREEVELSLREMNEELKAFAHMVAHDLRSPLSTVTVTLELILLMLETWPADKIRDRLVRTHGVAKQTAGVIDDLLILAMPNQVDVQLERIETAVIISDVLVQIELLTNQYEGEIIMPDEWHDGIGYEPWLVQIWSNLISNGIKYGGQPYRIELGSELMSNDQVRYWVDDNGAGIPAEKRDEIFKPFTRLKPDCVTGTGLGLTIVAKIVERLNGRTGIESSPLGGCRFYFELPNSPETVIMLR